MWPEVGTSDFGAARSTTPCTLFSAQSNPVKRRNRCVSSVLLILVCYSVLQKVCQK
jgi:hypothetical protein